MSNNVRPHVSVEVKADENNIFTGDRFFIKDENTLIVYGGYYCIEYKRISYDGGSKEPVIIIGVIGDVTFS